MFNEKFGMETATLNGSKTRTTRNLGVKVYKLAGLEGIDIKDAKIENGIIYLYFLNKWYKAPRENQPKYKVGEIVAIKQAYKHTNIDFIPCDEKGKCGNPKEMAGWTNKMFVKNELMPHRVKITNIILQRLQDISNEDCIKEGVIKNQIGYYVKGIRPNSIHCSYTIVDDVAYKLFPTPKEAYAALINKLNGKGTWDKNDWVWAIESELIK